MIGIEEATKAATEAFAEWRDAGPGQRAGLLNAAAEEIEADSEAIIKAAMAESHLPEARLTGELARTTGQLRLFATVARQGDHLGVRLDPALPDRTPLPRPDLRQRMIPLGPVAVFGASNFPLAFSTAGGDTASALAAGCPVIVKGHPAHPETGQLVAHAVRRAVRKVGAPAGLFSYLLGEGNEFGQALVADPRIKAVGFTGSRAGGLALMEIAAQRCEPIPVYAEMSSVNPVVILPGALDAGDPAGLAEGYVASMTLGAGQFCTNPGVVFVPRGVPGDAFLAAAAQEVRAATGQQMLTPGIVAAYAEGTKRLSETAGIDVLAQGLPGPGDGAPAPFLSAASAEVEEAFAEVFGASSVVIRYADPAELELKLSALEGQLTATVHYAPSDASDITAARRLLPVLEDKAGRILFNGWPTGVEVCHAMVHGGPFPATSHSRTTSVGTLAIERFQRPVCYQDVPAELLPEAVQDENPLGLTRRVDGSLELPH